MDPSRRTRGALLLLVPALAVAVVGGIVSISSRGDAAFEFEQQHPRTVSEPELENLVAKAREPTPTGPGAAASRVRCTAGGSTGQRNPWVCVVDYRSGNQIRYSVTVKDDGSYRGGDPTNQFFIDGCCVSGPSAGAG